MHGSSEVRRVATLWEVAWRDERLACRIYRHAEGLQLRVESGTTVIISEPFDLQPRALARTQTLRDSLKRRGWQDCPSA